MSDIQTMYFQSFTKLKTDHWMPRQEKINSLFVAMTRLVLELWVTFPRDKMGMV
jgi:hypothetical protein